MALSVFSLIAARQASSGWMAGILSATRHRPGTKGIMRAIPATLP
jgi:hypothetical protein